jgi:GWxTD domain-containing protein
MESNLPYLFMRGAVRAWCIASVFAAMISRPIHPEEYIMEEDLIERLSPAERQDYNSLQYLMNRYQVRQYLMLPTREARDEWIERFWIEMDPTPTTDVNERRLEHERRVLTARTLFPKQGDPGWDGRGEIWIRFGPPDHREKTFGHIDFWNERMPGEVWYYYAYGMLVSFEDIRLSGEYYYTLETFAVSARQQLQLHENRMRGAGGSTPKLPFILPQYIDPNQDSNIGYANPYVIDKFVAGYDVAMNHLQTLSIDVGDEHRKSEKAANRLYRYLQEKPFVHTAELGGYHMPVYCDVAAFRGGPGKLRTEVSFEIPASEILNTVNKRELGADVELRVLVRDCGSNKVAFGIDRIRSTTPLHTQNGIPLYMPGQVILTLEPGYYRLGLEAIDINTGRCGAYRMNINLQGLDGCLALSNIQFASGIRWTEENIKFVKGNVQVVPHPLHTYRIKEPLFFYFEIYGLDTDENDFAFYSIEYTIVPLTKQRWGFVLRDVATVLMSRFETTGLGPTQVQHVEIATDELWEGPHRLEVKVTDRRTMRVAETRGNFYITE